MSRTLSRRIAASVAAAAVVAGGTAFGAGVASADPGAPVVFAATGGTVPVPGQSYPKAATDSSENIRFTREVVGDGTVAPGGTVTYRTTFSVTSVVDRFLNKVVDLPPGPEFTYVAGSARAGGKTVDTAVDATTGGVTMTNFGWRLSKNTGDTVVFEVTYKAPDDLTIGNVYNSGIIFHPTTWATDQNFPNVGAWVKARGANPGEAVSGSLDGAGFGSSGPIANGSSGSGIVNDPAGFIADIISNVLKNGS